MEARRPATVNVGNGTKKFGPERNFFFGLRGKTVWLRLLSGEEVEGPLRWVDRFTLCVSTQGRDRMIYKHALESVSEKGTTTYGTGEAAL